MVEPFVAISFLVLSLFLLCLFIAMRRVTKDPNAEHVGELWQDLSESKSIGITSFRDILTALRESPGLARKVHHMHVASCWMHFLFSTLIFVIFFVFLTGFFWLFPSDAIEENLFLSWLVIAVAILVCLGALMRIGLILWELFASKRIKRWLTRTGVKFVDFDELFAHCTFTALRVPGIWRLPFIVVRRGNHAVTVPLHLGSLQAIAFQLVEESRVDAKVTG